MAAIPGFMVIKLASTIFIFILQNLSNQSTVLIGYNILIGCLSSISAKFVLESLMKMSPNLYINRHEYN